jgi:tetratricopeptide (TPR) repeat protein
LKKGFIILTIIISVAIFTTTLIHAQEKTSVEDLLKQAAEKQQNGDVDGAIALYNQVISIDPENYVAYHNLGIAYIIQKKWDAALEALIHAQLIDPTKGEDSYLAGFVYMNMKDFERAIVKFKRAIQLNYNGPDVYATLANAYQLTGKPAEALAAVQDGLKVNPDSVNLWLLAGGFNMTLNKTEEAIAAYQKVIELDPSVIPVYNMLGSIYSMSNRYEEAAVILKKGVETHPKNTDGYVLLSSVYYELNKMDDALLAARKAVELAPKNADALANLGYIYAERNEHLKEALDLCTQAAALAPKNSSILDSLGWVQYKNGQVAAAIETLQKAISIDSKEGWAHYHLAVIYLAQNQKQKAIDEYWLAKTCPTYSRKLTAELAALKAKLGV